MELVNAICPNCGAALKVNDEKDAAICEYCGNPYIVKKAVEKYNVTVVNHTTNNINANVVNIVDSNKEVTTTTEIYKIKPQVSEEYVKRRLIIKMSKSERVPDGIENITFGETQLAYARVIAYKARAEVSYSASIGYRETEHYVETQTRPDGSQYLVNKTREKMVWKPMSSQFTDEYAGSFSVESDMYASLNQFKDAPDEDVIKDDEETYVALTKEEIGEIRSHVDMSAHTDIYVSLPGDRHQDLRTNTLSTIKQVAIYKVPYYVLCYSLNNKVYTVKIPAAEDVDIIDKNTYEIHDLEERVYTNTRGNTERAVSIACWPIFAVMFLISIIVSARTPYGFLLFFLGTMPFIIIGNLIGKKSVNLYNAYVDEWNSYKSSERVDIFNTTMKNLGFKELSSEEKSQIKDGPAYKESYRLKGWIVALTVICSIAFGITVFSFIMYWAV